MHRERDAQRKNMSMASRAQWSCPGTSRIAMLHGPWALTLCQPFRKIYDQDAPVRQCSILTGSPCLGILHLRDSSKSVPRSNVYRDHQYVLQSGYTVDEREGKKKRKKDKMFL